MTPFLFQRSLFYLAVTFSLLISLLINSCSKEENPPQEIHQNAETQTNNNPHYMLRLTNGTDFQNIPAEHVIAISFIPEGTMSSFYRTISAEGSDSLTLLQHIDFENPFITEALPGSIVTGTLTITYLANDNTQETRTFRLLGTSLVQDVTYPHTYYNASEGLQSFLENP